MHGLCGCNDCYMDCFLNLAGERNSFNVDRLNYNCGGLALGTYNWYVPYDRDIYDHYGELMYDIDDIDAAVDYCVDHMLTQFPDGRVVNSVEELEPDEVGVIFRLGDEDFHFILYKEGTYYSKVGSWNTREVAEEEVYDEEWSEFYTYYSKIVILAMPDHSDAIKVA